MNNVFAVYGIEVNPRHLTLVADHMTNTGSILPFSRGAMSANASPLQKMTYETTLSFMRTAIMNGERKLAINGHAAARLIKNIAKNCPLSADPDHLDSPSARLVTGQTLRSGTGSFDLLADFKSVVKLSNANIEYYK